MQLRLYIHRQHLGAHPFDDYGELMKSHVQVLKFGGTSVGSGERYSARGADRRADAAKP